VSVREEAGGKKGCMGDNIAKGHDMVEFFTAGFDRKVVTLQVFGYIRIR
jgi:hypothetical protein